MSQDEKNLAAPVIPSAAETAPAPAEEIEPIRSTKAIKDQAHLVIHQLESDDKNPPLLKGHTRKFQKLWNRKFRLKAEKLPEDGALGRATKRAINRVLAG